MIALNSYHSLARQQGFASVYLLAAWKGRSSMKILILGGLSFLGRHFVEQGLAREHEMTVFTRGKTNADLYPEVEKLRGDRDGNLTALEGRRWDRVVDTSGYVPRIVRDSARLL